MDVGAWLRALGLGHYEGAFHDNSVDAEVLPRLTADDLRDLGVASVGHRRKLLDAIAKLEPAREGSPSSPEPPPSPSPPAISPSRRSPEASAERRPITVMFCDLVGSTSLAAKLDAEDWRNLVNAYLDEATNAVTGLGGHVLKRLGDGLMALFGYPHAQENDAERAVRAALAIQRGLVNLNAGNAAKGEPELSARIGLESGPVVVEAGGEVFGDAPNIAARVQAAADPGSVLITASVQRQVAGLFVVEDRGAQELKGAPAPVSLYRVVRASGGRRFGARTLTPLVGREEELDLLRRRWERAARGEGQLALVVGEPGIGKSRLIEEFHLKLGETPHTFVEWSSSQLLQNTPLHPIAEWGRQRFGADEPAERRLADLENTLALISLDPAEYAPLLAPLVDVPLPEERGVKLAPEELRRRQLAALTTWVLAGARSQPVLLAFEDLHWADPTTLDLLQALAERGRQAPLLILATTRPELRPPWSLRSHHSVISLKPLDRADVAQMIGELAARHALSQEVVEGLSERTGGVPLFVEEVTRLLLERGEAGGLQAIPPTLQQSLAARLDRLGDAREVAQIAAVLGRDFTYSLLASVAAVDDRGAALGERGYNDTALQSALDKLAGADLLIAEGAGPEANYRFKHALIQDAAYDSLLKSRRQALHRRAAKILAGQPERGAAEPEVIAHHFTQAGLDDLAIEWWGKAGDQALRRSAFQEAIAHLGKAIAMADKTTTATALTTVPETDASLRVKLQKDYAQAVQWSKGWGAAETKAAFERTDALATRPEMSAARFPGLFSQAVWNLARGEMRAARDIADCFLREAEAEGRMAEVGVARYVLGLVSMFSGELADARIHLQKALDTYDKERDRKVIAEFGFGNGSNASGALAVASWLQGDLQRARQLIEEAVWLGNEGGHLPTALNALTYKTIIESFGNDLAGLVGDAEKVLTTSRQLGMEFYAADAGVKLSWTRGRLGEAGHGADELKNSLDAYSRQGNRLATPAFLGFLAELEAAARDYERALAAIEEGLATAQECGMHFSDAFLHRLRGEILLKRHPANPAPAEDAFQTAIAIAKEQGARSFELRAALSLAKLYQSTGRPADAHAVLAPALEGFAPTPETPEIAEAQGLLAALAETDEVKATEAQRQRRTQLHVVYGNALAAARGIGAPETTEAFARAREAAFGDKNAPERLAVHYGLWAGSSVRGDLPEMRAHADAFLNDVESRPDSPEAGASGASGAGLEGMRRGVELLREQNVLWFDGLLKMALAEAEAQWGDPRRALAILDEALATCDRTGYRAFEAELHRVRGEMLLRRDPANPAPTEEALQTAIAVTKQQGTRSFEILAPLALAKLHQSTGRPVDAHAVLAPALEGFAPTPEMPEIAEAQALLAALAETEEVKADAARRHQRRELHVAYGNALIATRGYGAAETTEAFAIARGPSAGHVDRERLAADYGLWVGSYVRGELPSMRTRSADFLRDVAAGPDSAEASVAHRVLGITPWFAGEYANAHDHLERALVLFQPGRDDDLAFRFGQDPGVAAMLWLALTLWPLGEVERAASLVNDAQARVAKLTHVQTRMFGKLHAGLFALIRGDISQADSNVSGLAHLARDSGLDFFSPQRVILEGWVKAQTGIPAEGLDDMRRGVELLREQNVRVFDGLYKAMLAQAEARAGDVDRAIAILSEALATSEQTGHRTFDAELHRVRGEILLKRDPANPAPAEEALQTAVAVAKQQGTRSFGLRAALSLAKLYQAAGRPAEAYAVLAPALEGFAPTPETPEIAEAAALIAAIEARP